MPVHLLTNNQHKAGCNKTDSKLRAFNIRISRKINKLASEQFKLMTLNNVICSGLKVKVRDSGCKPTLFRPVVLKLGSTEPQGFAEAVAGVRLRSE